ncbi:MAG: hypothetical protein IPI79_13545 [Moraxellaceae bacterium]|nr:hypothetical protein [Moraxellaceae bacterium]MBK8325600.1 hypothetical protein [Moraxellaceae bacterium]
MSSVYVEVPSALYFKLYQRFGESAQKLIVENLQKLAGEEPRGDGRDNWPNKYRQPIAFSIWEISETTLSSEGPTREHKELSIKKCIEQGINENTATTIYSNWRKDWLSRNGELI